MALDGQVSYLSTDFTADLPRPRASRRNPRLRMNEEDEDETDSGRASENLGMRAPIIGYEVIDQRQKFTVSRPVRLVVFNTKTKTSSRILFFHFVICVVGR